MRVLILTTQTPHHARFVQALVEDGVDLHVLSETRGLVPPYETAHPFEAARDAYERDLWFSGNEPSLAALAPTAYCQRVNDPEGPAEIGRVKPDIVVDFGTGKLSPDVIAAGPPVFLNLHGGDPQRYRGLDTHLWAIWHGEWNGLVTCLHDLEAELDTGGIVGMTPLDLSACSSLEHLRAANTDVCISLVRAMLHAFEATGTVSSRAQTAKGRYYSFMPASLKAQCVEKFRRYRDRLHG